MNWNESVPYKPGDKVRDWEVGPSGFKRLWAWALFYMRLRPRPLAREGEWVTYECVGEYTKES